jgi:hypothetical protein
MLVPFVLSALIGIAPGADAPKPATNTKCPVMGEKVTEKSKTVTVKGREYRICCPGCGPKLTADPDKYLEKDGTPRNAKAEPAKK